MQAIGRSARMARHHKRHREATINLVSMIDMMTILVFFLLVHGGFVRLAVLELNLPTAQSEVTAETPEFQLEVTVRETGIEVGDRATGLLNRIDKTGDDYHLDELSVYLTRVKDQFPQKTDATLLLEPDISYQLVVAVMDRMRETERASESDGRLVRADLFPEISLGDAPVLN
jgi:biopolymer transport protein ExbD